MIIDLMTRKYEKWQIILIAIAQNGNQYKEVVYFLGLLKIFLIEIYGQNLTTS